MDEKLMLFGMALIFLGFLILAVGALFGGKGEAKFGVGGFIGPFPFGFANDPKLLKAIIILIFILAIALFLIPYIFRSKP